MRDATITKRWEFPVGLVLGLAKAVTDDEDVCLLAMSAVAPKRLSRALLAYVTFRRIDGYFSAYLARNTR